MRRIRTIAGIVLVILGPCQSLIGQSKQRKRAQSPEHVEVVNKRPDLGVDYARVASFKLGSRKTTYRVGEMISIDLAVMNVSDAPVFFHKLDRPSLELKAQDENGASVPINTYYTVLEGVAPKAYQRVEAGYILSDTLQLLAGCESPGLKAYFQATQNLEEEEHHGGERAFFKGLFERDLFVNWGQACFAIKKAGKYTITVEQSNETVLVSPSRLKVKTAVGTIRSSPLTLTIVE